MEKSVQSWHRREIFCHHLITLSALYSIDCGIVTPICFVVLRLMSSSNFVAAHGLFFLIIVINLRHHVYHLVAEAFLGGYLDGLVLSQLQRFQARFQHRDLRLLLL